MGLRIGSFAGALCAATFLLASADLAAQKEETPLDVARQHFEAMQSANWKKSTELMHPEELGRFKAMFAPVIAADSSGEGARELFGLEDPAVFAMLSDNEVFERFLATTVVESNMQTVLENTRVEFIGAVPEGDDRTHVVYRMTVHLDDYSPTTSMEVVSLRRYKGTWRMLLDRNLEGMQAMLVRVLQEMNEAPEEMEYEEEDYPEPDTEGTDEFYEEDEAPVDQG